MKVKDMHTKTAKQLEQHAEKLAKQLAELKTELVTKDEKNVRQIRAIRKERAQALTIATERAATEDNKPKEEDK